MEENTCLTFSSFLFKMDAKMVGVNFHEPNMKIGTI